jgi:hypothetical protein
MNDHATNKPSAQQLNAALCAYIHTIPNAERLRKFIWSIGLGSHEAGIQKEMRALVQATDNFLLAQTGGIVWNAAFEEQQFQHLREEFPWLGKEGYSAVLSYSGWLRLHEGLNAVP